MIGWKKIVFTVIVLIVAGALVFLIWDIMHRDPPGADVITESDANWIRNGQEYSYRSHQELVLFLGVGDSAEGKNDKLEYLTLIAVDDIRHTYSVLTVDPDTCVTVNVIDGYGKTHGLPYDGRIAEALTYGGEGFYSARNVGRSLKLLLHGREIDHFIEIRDDGKKPLFVTDPAAQLEAILSETGDETDENGAAVSCVVSTDLKLERIADLWGDLKESTCTGVRTLEGTRENGMLVLDAAKADDVICDLYFEQKIKTD